MLLKSLSEPPAVFGAFIDAVPRFSPKEFIGGNESFVFQLVPEEQAYYNVLNTDEVMVCGDSGLIVGSGNKGAAIVIDESLQKGQSNQSATFGNERLGGGPDEFFELHTIELYML